jgi:hypothetical protein
MSEDYFKDSRMYGVDTSSLEDRVGVLEVRCKVIEEHVEESLARCVGIVPVVNRQKSFFFRKRNPQSVAALIFRAVWSQLWMFSHRLWINCSIDPFFFFFFFFHRST